MIWQYIADEDPSLMRYCEIMTKTICRPSRFKSDDFNLKMS